MAAIFGDSLNDPRVDIREADVADVIGARASAFDAILLDVDNGPEGLIRTANDALYDPKGLKAIRRALRPGGVLAVWSAAPAISAMRPAFCGGMTLSRSALKVLWSRTELSLASLSTVTEPLVVRPPEGVMYLRRWPERYCRLG